MYRKIVVGFDGGEHANDGLALGRALAEVTGAKLVAACVYETLGVLPHSGVGKWQEEVRAAAEKTVAEAGAAETWTVESTSAARGLHDVADVEGADLLIVGSCHRGPAGRVLAGSTATRLLHESPCAFAVAPRGFAKQEPRLGTIAVFGTIAVGFDGGAEASAALEGAVELARASGANLLLVGVVALASTVLETRSFEAAPELFEARREHAEQALKRGLEQVPDGVEAQAELLEGSTDELGERSDVDLLVVGSRGHGPLRRAVLGSTAAMLIHHARYPVLVFPRGATEDKRPAVAETAGASESS